MLRTILIAVVGIHTATAAIANPIDSNSKNGILSRSRELSGFYDANLISDFMRLNVIGVQYRKQKTSLWSWRSSSGYFNYVDEGVRIYQRPFNEDTVRTRKVDRVLSGGCVSGGVEVQRQFYKQVYLYAGAELRVGYGDAFIDTHQSVQYNYATPNGLQYSSSMSRSRVAVDGNGILISGAFLVGAKLYAGNRLTIGSEFSNPAFWVRTRTPESPDPIKIVSFSLPQVMQRFYIGWRF